MSTETRSFVHPEDYSLTEPVVPPGAGTDAAEAECSEPPSLLAPSGITLRRVLRWMLVGSALCALGWLFWSNRSVLLPFQIGLVIAYLILPLVNWLEQRVPRVIAILGVYLIGHILFVAFVAFVVPPLVIQAGNFIGAFPTLQEIEQDMAQMLDSYQRTVPISIQEPLNQGITQMVDTLQSNLTTYMQEVGTFLLTSMLQIVNTVTFVLGFFIVPFWLFYVLKDEQAGVSRLNTMVPDWMRADFWAMIKMVDRVFSSYIRGQLFLGLVVGVCAGIGLFVLRLFGFKVDFILILAIIAGVTELIPIIGPVIGAIPAIILGFFDSPTTGLVVTILYITIQQLENNFLVPRIVGGSVGIHPAILMVLFVVLGQTLGLVGIILSAPIAAVVRDMFLYVYGRLGDPPRPAGLLPGLQKDEH